MAFRVSTTVVEKQRRSRKPLRENVTRMDSFQKRQELFNLTSLRMARPHARGFVRDAEREVDGYFQSKKAAALAVMCATRPSGTRARCHFFQIVVVARAIFWT